MSATVTPRTVTQYPANEPQVITAPMNQPMAVDALVGNSATVANLQAQLASLEARVAALEAGR